MEVEIKGLRHALCQLPHLDHFCDRSVVPKWGQCGYILEQVALQENDSFNLNYSL